MFLTLEDLSFIDDNSLFVFDNRKLIDLITLILFRVEVFDKDKLGKDKSLGKVEVNPRDLDSEPKWFPLQVRYF